MFVLKSNITLGQFKKVLPHDVKISKSVYSYVDRAVIKMPTTARLKRANEVLTESAPTAKQFIEGDFVNIELGYNGKMVNEFTGFISKINFGTPLEIECEGYSYLLRKKRYLKSFKNTSLIEVLKFLIIGTGITLSKDHIVDMPLPTILFENQNGTECLEKIKNSLNNLINIYFKGNVLHAELFPVKPFIKTVYYKIGWNVILDDSLKIKEPSNDVFIIKFNSTKNDGSKSEIEHKEKKSGSLKTYTNDVEVIDVKTQITDPEAKKKLAKSYADKKRFQGCEGKIKGFLQPYCETAWKAAITDEKFPDRSGIYVITSTEVTYGMSGARRTVEIGFKLKDLKDK